MHLCNGVLMLLCHQVGRASHLVQPVELVALTTGLASGLGGLVRSRYGQLKASGTQHGQ